MNQRHDAGFEPSPESYEAEAVATPLEVLRSALAAQNVTRQADVDLYVAVIGGLIDAQLANDRPGWEIAGSRSCSDRAIDHARRRPGRPRPGMILRSTREITMTTQSPAR